MEFVACGEPLSLAGAALVVSDDGFTVAGALASDLLVTSYGLTRRGYLLCPHVLPCVGNDALGVGPPTGALSTGLELFSSTDGRLAVLQRRAPVARGAARAFSDALAGWAASAGFSRLLLLAGCEAAAAPAAALQHPFCVLPAALDWPVLDEAGGWGGAELATATAPPWALRAAAGRAGLPAHALLQFAAAGDNTGHAATLASRSVELLGLEAPAGGWRSPASWAAALYGSDVSALV